VEGAAVLWFSFWFSFLCANRITRCKVSITVYCCTSIWQLAYIFYTNIALYVRLLMAFKGKKV